MGKRAEQLRDRLRAVGKATDEARGAYVGAESRLVELEDRERRENERRLRLREGSR
jgi:hypothetical protein